MHDHLFLEALALVLCVAAVTSVLFQRIHLPVVLGYVLAGLIVGPHVPVPFIADSHIVETLSELGVILLMFSLGLEFSLRKFLRVGLTAGFTALIECSIQFWLGFMIGSAMGWSVRESLFTGAIIAISSTTIIAKAFDEQNVNRNLRSLVVSVLIAEDLIAIVLMAGLTAMGESESLSLGTLAKSSARLVAFLGTVLVLGLLLIPRGIRMITALQRPETTLVASIGLCFGLAYLAQRFGYSVALGAFLAGSLIAESGRQRKIEPLVEPVRDMFAAVFFVSVGMSIEPVVIIEHWREIAILSSVVVIGKITGVTLGSFLTGSGTRLSIRAGMSLAQIGEFSFILAGLGKSLGATRDFLYPTVVAVSAITTLTTPWFIKSSEKSARFVERSMPSNVQSFLALYSSWLERLQTAARSGGPTEVSTRRFAKLLALDTILLGALVIGTALYAEEAAHVIKGALNTSDNLTRIIVVVLVIAAAAPLLIGIVNVVRHLALELSETALPASQGARPELSAAARRALSISLQLAVLLLTGLPLVAVTQPFLHGLQGAMVFAGVLVIGAIAVFRRARNLHGEVRAGTQLIVAALKQGETDLTGPVLRPDVQHFLSELGEPKQVRLSAQCAAVGQTLVSLDVRGSTGATVLAIAREHEGAIVPTGREVLRENDVLVLAGTHEAVAHARKLLNGAAAAAAAPTV
ncbi:MAG: cation:proton antiporter [Polyangiales bacterium]